MKIAIVGGTGSFGLALAQRVAAAGYDVVIGSRVAGRAGEAAAGIGGTVTGAANADACRGADLVVLATKAEAAVETARELREAIGSTPQEYEDFVAKEQARWKDVIQRAKIKID